MGCFLIQGACAKHPTNFLQLPITRVRVVQKSPQTLLNACIYAANPNASTPANLVVEVPTKMRCEWLLRDFVMMPLHLLLWGTDLQLTVEYFDQGT